jgi:glycyl-tRNA synthetase (class II)
MVSIQRQKKEICMKSCYTNAMVMWNEEEIERRESLIREIPMLLKTTWRELNKAIRMERVETPILTPANRIEGHIKTGFNLVGTSEENLYLRPETTAGTFEAFDKTFNQSEQYLQAQLPYCMWQVGLSFRNEKNADTMRATKLRLMQFYQIEFQLFTSLSTKASYLEPTLEALVKRYGGEFKPADELPHYSEKTLDWYMGDLEVAGCSVRTDWKHGKVYEIAIGLDRLVALQLNK